jgi:hypothetical protein
MGLCWFATVWSLWKGKNLVIFSQKQFNKDQILERVKFWFGVG